eukprot:TRINITY_DN67646_c0_g1_i1.p1 TRINITY_DN67646_c0_g1~~TRINITY_DN67646_c0_g1_i1.p1  ORF type:complete len:921 (+),score=163.66 TRINITY_DN67646_c0_g1_i1:49-2763(+)
MLTVEHQDVVAVADEAVERCVTTEEVTSVVKLDTSEIRIEGCSEKLGESILEHEEGRVEAKCDELRESFAELADDKATLPCGVLLEMGVEGDVDAVHMGEENGGACSTQTRCAQLESGGGHALVTAVVAERDDGDRDAHFDVDSAVVLPNAGEQVVGQSGAHMCVDSDAHDAAQTVDTGGAAGQLDVEDSQAVVSGRQTPTPANTCSAGVESLAPEAEGLSEDRVKEVASPQRKSLEPSLQALAASRSILPPANVGPSETSQSVGGGTNSSNGGGNANAAKQHRSRRLRGGVEDSVGSATSRSTSAQRGLRSTERDETTGSCSTRSGVASPLRHDQASPHDGKSADWQHSLRGDGASRKVEPWRPQLTVPSGPRLRTQERSRSRSESRSRGRSSECNTPEGHSRSSTPLRRGHGGRSMSPLRHMTPRESGAIEQHIGRIAERKLLSTSLVQQHGHESVHSSNGSRSASVPVWATWQGSGEEASAADDDVGFGDQGTPGSIDTVSSTLASNVASRISPRLSRLTRPNMKRGQSSDDMQLLRMEIMRRELKEKRLANAQSCVEAILNPDANVVPSPTPPTVPRGPDLSTAVRARSRSSSRNRSEVDGVSPECHHRSISAERRPAALAVVAAEAAAALARSAHAKQGGCTSVTTKTSPRNARGRIQVPSDVDLQQWMREAPTAEERAQRARAVAVAKTEKAAAKKQAGLCIFKASGGRDWAAKPAVPGGKRPIGAPHCIFKPSNRKPAPSGADSGAVDDGEATPAASSGSGGSGHEVVVNDDSPARLDSATAAALAAAAAMVATDGGLPMSQDASTAACYVGAVSSANAPCETSASRPSSARGCRAGVGAAALTSTRMAVTRSDSSTSLGNHSQPTTPRQASKAKKPSGVGMGFGSRTSRSCFIDKP